MKKSLIALAAVAVAGIASAQSSVTLFGVLDAGVSYSDAKQTNYDGSNRKASKWSQNTGGIATSRIGFRGTEDLGGGMAASFWLEAGLNNDTGAAGSTSVGLGGNTRGASFFNRRSTVSLSGGFGEVRIGRDYTASATTDSTYDPFGYTGSGSSLIATTNAFNFGANANGSLTGTSGTTDSNYPRASNMVAYFLPANIGGVYGSAQYGLDENVTTGDLHSKAGRYAGGRVGYANGPLDVSAAYGQSTLADTSNVFTATGSKSQVKTANLGASYDFGMAKAFAEISQSKFDQNFYTPAASLGYKLQGYLIGATVPVGAGLIKASYSSVKAKDQYIGADPKASQFALGYVHNLSKRTALYATYSHIADKNGAPITTGASGGVPASVFNVGAAASGAATGTMKSANGYDFGIRHSF